jgi:hypothetical protein
VLIVAHEVVVLRYVLETPKEKAILAIDAERDVANCSQAEYHDEARAGRSAKFVLQRRN